MLEVIELHSHYGTAHILQGLSLAVPLGKVVSVLGRNGMGKTTLVRSIMGLTPPEVRSGDVRYQGEALRGLSPYEIARRGLGLVPQGRRVFRSLSVLENLTLAARGPQGNGKPAWTLSRVFALFPRLEERKHQRAGTLSGGEQQMLAIARTLMTNPSLLLMDEPSEGLAPLLVSQLRDQILALKETGIAILLVEQNLGLAMALADEVYVIEKGMVVFNGTPQDLEANPELRQRHLGVG
ncbi:MAG: ABC transporter ATP-binding protein [Candidatus Tectimicrobiota bacterium]|nr:MAG: ABC transporter ATP-binding protein [Candidatus Tectomicrobia bacterium]